MFLNVDYTLFLWRVDGVKISTTKLNGDLLK